MGRPNRGDGDGLSGGGQTVCLSHFGKEMSATKSEPTTDRGLPDRKKKRAGKGGNHRGNGGGVGGRGAAVNRFELLGEKAERRDDQRKRIASVRTGGDRVAHYGRSQGKRHPTRWSQEVDAWASSVWGRNCTIVRARVSNDGKNQVRAEGGATSALAEGSHRGYDPPKKND